MPNIVNFGQVADAIAAGRQAASIVNLSPASPQGAGQGTITPGLASGLMQAAVARAALAPASAFMWGQTKWGDKTYKVTT